MSTRGWYQHESRIPHVDMAVLLHTLLYYPSLAIIVLGILAVLGCGVVVLLALVFGPPA